jgi:hypothetical protein
MKTILEKLISLGILLTMIACTHNGSSDLGFGINQEQQAISGPDADKDDPDKVGGGTGGAAGPTLVCTDHLDQNPDIGHLVLDGFSLVNGVGGSITNMNLDCNFLHLSDAFAKACISGAMVDIVSELSQYYGISAVDLNILSCDKFLDDKPNIDLKIQSTCVDNTPLADLYLKAVDYFACHL